MTLLSALFAPQRIALIGASSDASRVTARAQLFLRRHGFEGRLYLVNPRSAAVLGEPAYPRLAALPEPVDFAYILVGTALVPDALAECIAQHVPVVCILADGFADAGPRGVAAEKALVATARAGGVRLIGPNSMGIVNLPARIVCSVNAALEAANLPSGGLSLVSHSGSMMGALISRAAARGIGFAKLIGTGNEADLSAGEIAAALVDDPETKAILLFLETIRDPAAIAAAGRRARARNKPMIVYRLGRSEAGARLAVTHTGAIAGNDPAIAAFLRANGILAVDQLEALLEIPPLAAHGPPKKPHRAVRVVTTTGGGGAMVVDRLALAGVRTLHVEDTTLAGARRGTVETALAEARHAEDADLAIAVIGSSAQFHPEEAVAGVIAASGPLPVVAAVMPEAPQSLRLFADAAIAAFRTPEGCAGAVRAWLDWREPRSAPPIRDLSAARALLPKARDEAGARAVFAALGVADTARIIDPNAPPPLAYPVALKACSPALPHKTEAGAVVLNVPDAAALARAAHAMRARLGDRIERFLAQPMALGLAEVILGFRRDRIAGPIVALGVGGVLAEIYRDVVLRVAPVTEAEAREMIEAVRGLASVRGYRGLPKGDLAALARTIAVFSELGTMAEVAEAEINPLIVLPEGEGVVMADALLRCK